MTRRDRLADPTSFKPTERISPWLGDELR